MCPVTVEKLDDIDLVLVTHGAPDHLGDGISIMKQNTRAMLVGDHDVRVHAIRKGIPDSRVKTLVWGAELQLFGVRIKAVENRHVSFLKNDEDGYITGLPLSYMVYPDNDKISGIALYHAGDTSIFSDMRLLGELYRPDVALIPVGAAPGFYPELSASEAAQAIQWMAPSLAIPMHYEQGSGDPELFLNILKALSPRTMGVKMSPGETIRFQRSITVEKVLPDMIPPA